MLRSRRTTARCFALGLAIVGAITSLPVSRHAEAAMLATAGATNVRDFGAGLGGDDTAAFQAAMQAATQRTLRYSPGPAGDQAVVYVPAGRYRLLDLFFPSDMRLEVDAGAILQGAGTPGSSGSLIVWDAKGTPLRNVSIVGVGRGGNSLKKKADPVEDGWNIANSFTFNLDPYKTNTSNRLAAVVLRNVHEFLIENVYSVQNDSTPVADANGGAEWPTTSRAAMILKARNDSPLDQPLDPRNGRIVNHYNIQGPRGFGPNQVQSAHDVAFEGIYTSGGTALRLETDDAHGKWGSEINGLRADTIVGENCNRAVSFSPHDQHNSDVHIGKIIARNCYEGIVESTDRDLPIDERGSFVGSTVDAVDVLGGYGAQEPDDALRWVVGSSYRSFTNEGTVWDVLYGNASCSGVFTKASQPLLFGDGSKRPVCS